MAKFDLSIVILNFNSQYWLKKTLHSLKEYYLDTTKTNVEVIVVDNDSTDDSVKMLRADFPWIKLIVAEENRGFSAGNNLALKEVDSRYAMLLNSDVELTSDSNLDELIHYLDKHLEVGVITPTLKLSTGQLDMACHRGEPTLWATLTYMMGLEKLFPKSKLFGQYHQLYKDVDQIHSIDACSGAAMIVRTSAMNEVGLLDEQFFMYAEDLDWCKRFREAGYDVIFYPEVSLIHHKYKSGISSASRQISAKTKGMFYDTMLQYYDKHYRKTYPAWVRKMVYYFIQIKKGAV